jgi:class 3 adenylate cyclase/tetratricopeptide (TPR) repeat protein
MNKVLMDITVKRLLVASLLFCSLVSQSYSQSDHQADSLLTEIKSAKVDTHKVGLMIELAKFYMSSDVTKTAEYAIKAEELSVRINYQLGHANALRYHGLADYLQGAYGEAVDHWQHSVEIFDQIGDQENVARLYSNIGAVYFNQSDDITALEYYLKSQKVAEEINDTLRLMTALTNIGAIYGQKAKTFDQALEYDLRALAMGEKLKDDNIVGTLASNIGEIYLAQGKDSLALSYFYESLFAHEGTENESYALRGIAKVHKQRGEYNDALRELEKSLALATNLDAKMDMSQSLRDLAVVKMEMGRHADALKDYEQALAYAIEIGSKQDQKDIYSGLAKTYEKQKDYASAFKYSQLLTELKDTLYNIEFDQKMSGQLFNYEIEKKQDEISLLNKDKELQTLETKRQRFVKQAFQAGTGLIVLIALILLKMYNTKVKTNRLLDQQKDEIESLLLNTLPAYVVRELETTGESKPKYYDQVSVLFTDFKGFTSLASALTPNELVAELTTFFTAFDDIIGKYELEKIKTIGDSYMCAGGVPKEIEDQPLKIIRAALEIQSYTTIVNKQRVIDGLPPWELRVGVHTGPVVAGVVGKKKYAYDIWGDTVNTASRMESNSEAGRVNVSEVTYQLIKDHYECEFRGKIPAKNLGEIEMYFVGPPMPKEKEIWNKMREAEVQ